MHCLDISRTCRFRCSCKILLAISTSFAKKMLPADRVYSGKDACDLVKTYNFPMMKMRHPEGHKLQSANVSVNADKLAVTVRVRGCLSLYSCLAVSVKCTHVTDGA